MMFPLRISTCPTIPELLRADADCRAARRIASLPVEVWCRPAVIGVVWSYRDLDFRGVSRERDVVRSRRDLVHSSKDLTRGRTVMRATMPQGCPTAARTRTLARSRRAALQFNLTPDALTVWSHRSRMKACFAGANGVLAVTRIMNACGLLSPDGVGTGVACADRLTRAGMRIWQRSRTAAEAKRA